MKPGALRLLLALVVVVHHSFPIRLGGWAVGLFFVLSGYWISRMWRHKYMHMRSPYGNFLASRWWRLAPIFLTVNVLAAVMCITGFSVGNPDAANDWRWWLGQPPILGSTQIERLLPPDWSLDVEMQFYLLAPLAVLLVGMCTTKQMLGVLAILLGWWLYQLRMGASLESPRIDLFAWAFLFGVMWERLDLRPSKWIIGASMLLFVALLTIIVILPETRNLVWHRGADRAVESSFWTGCFQSALVVIALPFAMSTVSVTSTRADRWLGDLSYPLYLFHWLPRDWYYSQLDWSEPAWWNAGLLAANVSAALLGAVVLLQFVDRPMQRFRETWCDEREAVSYMERLHGARAK